MRRSVTFLVATLVALVAPPLRASDHLDGTASSKDRVTDITDLYAFPTPQAPGFLTIILDIYPVVAASGHFSDKVSYSIYLRRAAIRSGDRPAFDRGSGDGLHLFAGQRSDPFFFNPVFAAAFSRGKLVTPREQDIMTGTNALALVIDVEVNKLFPNDPPQLLALGAESTTQDSPDAPVRRLDRLGRPEATNITLAANDDDPDLRDQYNTDRPFTVPAEHARVYRERVAKNLALFDRADGRSDWNDENRLALAELLVDDFLVVDIGLPCDQPAYLEIERSLLAHKQHKTCGGRKPADDIMDVVFTLSAGGLGGTLIGDGVDHPSRPISSQFPYLAAPDVSAASAIKTTVLGESGCGCRRVGTGDAGGAAAPAALVLWAARMRKRRRRG